VPSQCTTSARIWLLFPRVHVVTSHRDVPVICCLDSWMDLFGERPLPVFHVCSIFNQNGSSWMLLGHPQLTHEGTLRLRMLRSFAPFESDGTLPIPTQRDPKRMRGWTTIPENSNLTLERTNICC
jgi:hypothetical protein